jgi:DNA repair protein RadC
MARSDRPREKLATKGARALSDDELWMVILGAGTERHPVQKLATLVRKLSDELGENLSLDVVKRVDGLGAAKAAQVMAVHELRRRGSAQRARRVQKPDDALPHVAFIADRKQEHLVCLSLSGSGEVLATRVVSVGLLDGAPVHPREVFADPLADRAAAVILAHNHPSGNPLPSRRDIAVTRKLVEAGHLLGIEVLDHLILAGDRFSSMRKRKLI